MEGNGISNINIIDLNFVEPKVLENLFDTKAEKMKSNKYLKLDNETKLKFYGLFKVATVGPITEINKKSVGLFDFTEKYKK
jgi:acyl-CoA-binding protein